jgi:hypothetical protein
LGKGRNATVALIAAFQALALMGAAGVGACLGDHVTAALAVALTLGLVNALAYAAASRSYRGLGVVPAFI